MSYDQKIQSARKIINEHNSNADNQVKFEEFVKKLTNLGGSSDDALRAVSWEDLQDCGLPKIMARRLTYIFRKTSDDNGGKSTYISEKKVAMLSYKELIEHYNPKDVKNSVGKRLKNLSDGKKFIVFDNDSKVITDETVKLLEDIINVLPEVDTAFVNGMPLQTYSVGERPDFYAEENPIYPGRALRSNEACDQTGRSWQGVALEIRQLLWIAVEETEELIISSVANASDVLDKVLSKDCSTISLRTRYPEASKKLDEYAKIGRPPLLKIRIGEQGSGRKGNNPFGNNTTY